MTMKNTAVTCVAFSTLLLGAALSASAQDFVFVEHPEEENILRVETRHTINTFIVDSDDSGNHNVEAGASLADGNEYGDYLHAALVGVTVYDQSWMSLSGIVEHSHEPGTTMGGIQQFTAFWQDDPDDRDLRYWGVIDSAIWPEETPCTLYGSFDLSYQNAAAGTINPSGLFSVWVDGQLRANLTLNGNQVRMEAYPFSFPPPDWETLDPDTDQASFPFEIEAEVGSVVEVRTRALLSASGSATDSLVSSLTFDVDILVDY